LVLDGEGEDDAEEEDADGVGWQNGGMQPCEGVTDGWPGWVGWPG
jgi:hypothetical protein